jgi:Tat protein secretion system quality control protein TatD with DNase activity
MKLYDAHCHPTDTMSSIDDLSSLRTAGLCIMATRRHDQALVDQTAERFHEKVVPCFGFHPWFVHSIYDDRGGAPCPDRSEHYCRVIKPSPDDAFLATLPDPVPLSAHLDSISCNLEKYPLAMVGEVGLDKSFRIPDKNQPREDSNRSRLSKYKTDLFHQSILLKAQLELAGKYQRACSIHGVQAHGLLFDEISALWKGHELPSKSSVKKQASEARKNGPDHQSLTITRDILTGKSQPFPPRICLHSYSGTRESVSTWINPRIPAKVFFSFSQVINGRYDRWAEVVASIPEDSILIESDYHDCRLIDNSLEEAMKFVRQVRGWGLEEAESILAANWHHFVHGVDA